MEFGFIKRFVLFCILGVLVFIFYHGWPRITQYPTHGWPRTTQYPTLNPSTTQYPTLNPSTTQYPTLNPSTTQHPTLNPSTTQYPTLNPSTTQYPTLNPSTTQHPTQHPTLNPLRSRKKNLTILLWHWPFKYSASLEGDVCWDLYQIPHCKLVDQRSFYPAADVVVFHNRELIEGSQKLPTHLPRPKGQRWAWMSLESPDNNGNLRPFANLFNMTISYRRDADVTVPYGELLPVETEEHLVEDRRVNKSSLVCWVVSNYRSHYKRSRVYKELSATVPIKVYGRWSNTPLPSGDLLPTISSCYFYLAFENSVSKDYITEKLWYNAYQAGAVPVVLGPPINHYKAVAPEHSFIHVDEFASIKDLGKYLQQLAGDKKRYNEYFNWRKHWKVKMNQGWREMACNVCTRYDTLLQHKVYSDLESWDKTTL